MARTVLAGAAPRNDLRAIAGWAILVIGAGALAGSLIGGIGGRLAMLQLRRESPLAVGLTSDAGFEIGRVTLAGTLGLVVVTGVLGAAFGVLYAIVRLGLPAVARVPAAALVGGTFGGHSFLDPDGIDLLVLGPRWLAVAAFVALPALAATVAAAAIERGARERPWPLPLALPARAVTATRALVTALVAIFIAAQATALADVIDRLPS
ncbi:MAG: hypothetical protein JHC74_04345 [Thermoleophilia bacterium]|nr:hypothetical protein [Thermoleophilia bacterium]